MKKGWMITALLALLALCAACAAPSAATQPPAQTSQAEVTPPAETPAPTGPIDVQTATRDESGEYETKTASFPITGIASIDEEAVRIVDAALAEPVGDPNMPDREGISLVEYHVARNDGDVFSVVYQIYTYYSGAAHGTTAYISRNYEMPSGKPVALEDLFADSGYVIRLSTIAREKLEQNDVDIPEDTSLLEPDIWFFEGVSADPENFENFLILEDGMQLIFSNYQVAPYVVGQVRLTIPWEDLSDIMTPQWQERVGA